MPCLDMTRIVKSGCKSMLIVLWALSIAACGNTAEPPTQPAKTVMAEVSAADLVIRGGPVITVDPTLGIQRAVAIRGHEIVAVGSDDAVMPYIGELTEVIELNGRPLVPGFIEGHGHFMSLGRAQQILDLSQAQSFADIIGQVAIAADSAKPGEWIFGRGWHQDKWQPESEFTPELIDGVPVNTPLNAVTENNPVYLVHASGHAAYANDAALKLADINAATPDPDGGTIVRDAAGKATGLLRENAQGLAEQAIEVYQSRFTPEQQHKQFRDQVRLAGENALSHGITSFHDAGASFAHIDAFRALETAAELPVRLYVMVRGESNADMDAKLEDYFMPIEGNDFLTVRSIKRQIDGALGAHGAWLLEPYADLPDSTGLILEPIKEIEQSAHIAIKNGFQINTHAIGTRANRETLDLYERSWKASNVDGSNLRWRVEHAQHIHPDDIPRFAQLGVIAAVQGVHCTSDGPWIPSRLGPTRTQLTSYRWRDLIDSGARLNNGTDVPVENINPIASYYASVARVMRNGESFNPGQAMTRMEALKSYTLDNAYSAFEEQAKGSITIGKLADLVVLSQNILSVPIDKIPNTQVDMTIVGGGGEIHSRLMLSRALQQYHFLHLAGLGHVRHWLN